MPKRESEPGACDLHVSALQVTSSAPGFGVLGTPIDSWCLWIQLELIPRIMTRASHDLLTSPLGSRSSRAG